MKLAQGPKYGIVMFIRHLLMALLEKYSNISHILFRQNLIYKPEIYI